MLKAIYADGIIIDGGCVYYTDSTYCGSTGTSLWRNKCITFDNTYALLDVEILSHPRPDKPAMKQVVVGCRAGLYLVNYVLSPRFHLWQLQQPQQIHNLFLT